MSTSFARVSALCGSPTDGSAALAVAAVDVRAAIERRRRGR
jgi:hypothetical protein